ncbi:DUF6916 family protein [Marinicella sp. W31]|uniref:DUF6916 family protein n=1 Tax=Marinicella sp. W31 TaxID=3023713 RepID=UPI003757ADD5
MSTIHQNLFEQFQSLKEFQILREDAPLAATIEEVKELNSYAEGKISFSLLFHIEDSDIQEQGIFEIAAEGVDAMSVFVVPTNQYDNKTQYEIIFN